MAKGQPQMPVRTCFFITPIGSAGSADRQRADWAFHYVVEPAAVANKLRAERADLMVGSSMIGTNIFRSISESDVCVADLTGLNPNVLYEIGVRHSLRKPIIHIAQNDTKLPFDNAPHLTYFYDLNDYSSMNELKSKIIDEIENVLDDSYEVSNPFTQALGAIQIDKSGDPKDKLISNLIDRVSAIENGARQADQIRPIAIDGVNHARSILESFIKYAGSGSRYNETTFDNAIQLVKDDEELLGRVYDALSESSRPNKSALERILYTHYIPF